ncbi:MAG: biotin/lipoyl-binding protein [Ilumatobacteraceae bacterium]|nr:biotin/lipoyl-binding protein [Ilumatobacteraceae bacterium]
MANNHTPVRIARRDEYKARPIQKTALVTLIALIAWAGFTQMDEAVSASGVVVTPARMQVVQSPDGGIIARLAVSEGQAVKRGELIAVLEKQRANAATEDLLAQRAALHLAMTRAQAEMLSLYHVVDRLHENDEFSRDWRSFDALKSGDQIGTRADGTAHERGARCSERDHDVVTCSDAETGRRVVAGTCTKNEAVTYN